MSGARLRAVVVGDLLLDVDVEGEVERLTPYAPVPVLDVVSETKRAGGAGLVATLLARDGHDVTLVTALSDDARATDLPRLLDGVALVAGRSPSPTVVKTRIRSREQPIVRIDEGSAPAEAPEVTAAMLEAVRAADQRVDQVLGMRHQPEDVESGREHARGARARRSERASAAFTRARRKHRRTRRNGLLALRRHDFHRNVARAFAAVFHAQHARIANDVHIEAFERRKLARSIFRTGEFLAKTVQAEAIVDALLQNAALAAFAIDEHHTRAFARSRSSRGDTRRAATDNSNDLFERGARGD